jgi:hypothetical protein
MPMQLLPASAAAFAPRSAPNIVLNTKVEPWLTQTLKRINKIKRPLNSVPQHMRCLTETLGGELAIWSLTSLMLPKAADTELRKDSNPLMEALHNYQLVHVEAYGRVPQGHLLSGCFRQHLELARERDPVEEDAR